MTEDYTTDLSHYHILYKQTISPLVTVKYYKKVEIFDILPSMGMKVEDMV